MFKTLLKVAVGVAIALLVTIAVLAIKGDTAAAVRLTKVTFGGFFAGVGNVLEFIVALFS
jgi:hypothetical protein